jgi:hypothetical protein
MIAAQNAKRFGMVIPPVAAPVRAASSIFDK